MNSTAKIRQPDLAGRIDWGRTLIEWSPIFGLFRSLLEDFGTWREDEELAFYAPHREVLNLIN